MNLKCWNNKAVPQKTDMQLEQKPEKCSFKIDVQLLLVKMAHFVMFGALAGLIPYLAVFMGVLGLTPIQMSIIIAAAKVSSSPARLIIGYLADRCQKRPLVFAISAIVSALFHSSLYFTPASNPATGNMTCFHGNYTDSVGNLTSSLFLSSSNLSEFDRDSYKCCPNDLSLQDECKMVFSYISNNQSTESIKFEKTNQSLLTACLDACNITSQQFESDHSSKGSTFIVFFVLYFFAQVAYSPLISILDSLIHASLTRSNKTSEFGKCRVWGSIGYGVCAFLSGFMIDLLSNYGWSGRSIFVLNFVIIGFGLVLSSVITIFIGHSGKKTTAKEIETIVPGSETLESVEMIVDEAENNSIFKDKKKLMKIFCSFYLSMVILTGLVSGTIVGSTEGFFYYFLNSLDSNNKLTIGVCLAVACVSEAIFLYFSGRIIKKLGYQRCLYIVFATYFCRLLASSFITNPWFGPLVDAGHGLCFGLLFPVMSTWASSLVPRELHSTVQCYLGAVYYDLGRAVGSGLGGVIYQVYGPRIMFRSIAVVSLIYLIILIFSFEVIDKIRIKRQTILRSKPEESESKA